MSNTILSRSIPADKASLPAIGLGTWIQFDVAADAPERPQLVEVLQTMRAHGGTVIDSSPMYGRSEEVVGDLTAATGAPNDFFYATKVWTTGREEGIRQMNDSLRKMRRERMDLIQVHNLVDWRTHWKTLTAWKAEGKIRYTGITHYKSAEHENLEAVIREARPDFVQFNYSMRDRHAEKRLLQVAQDFGVATLINEPLEKGRLFQAAAGKALPEWAEEYDIHSWGQFFLKYLLAHPAVTCLIPGTSVPRNMADNLAAGLGRLPDEAGRKKMANLVDSWSV